MTQNTEIQTASGGNTDPDHGVKAKQRKLESTGDGTTDDRSHGDSTNHQAPPCNVQRGLVDETPSAIKDNNDGFSDYNGESWYHLKRNVESFYDWKTNEETTLFCLHEINQSVPIKAICQMSETSQFWVYRIALALLCFYHYENMSVRQVVCSPF